MTSVVYHNIILLLAVFKFDKSTIIAVDKLMLNPLQQDCAGGIFELFKVKQISL